jgi:hypothetical protein
MVTVFSLSMITHGHTNGLCIDLEARYVAEHFLGHLVANPPLTFGHPDTVSFDQVLSALR